MRILPILTLLLAYCMATAPALAADPPGRGQAAAAAKTDKAPSKAAKQACGSKTHCKDMKDCAEARFYLENCGVSRLDNDKDGIPCESLCGH